MLLTLTGADATLVAFGASIGPTAALAIFLAIGVACGAYMVANMVFLLEAIREPRLRMLVCSLNGWPLGMLFAAAVAWATADWRLFFALVGSVALVIAGLLVSARKTQLVKVAAILPTAMQLVRERRLSPLAQSASACRLRSASNRPPQSLQAASRALVKPTSATDGDHDDDNVDDRRRRTRKSPFTATQRERARIARLSRRGGGERAPNDALDDADDAAKSSHADDSRRRCAHFNANINILGFVARRRQRRARRSSPPRCAPLLLWRLVDRLVRLLFLDRQAAWLTICKFSDDGRIQVYARPRAGGARRSVRVRNAKTHRTRERWRCGGRMLVVGSWRLVLLRLVDERLHNDSLDRDHGEHR